jgi:glyoxylase-like metal-dependent hydrolase (beta-lactamase superfamily II)
VHPIKLDNEVFEGENALYLLGHDADGPTTLVDTGIDTPDTERQLRDQLATVDVAVTDVDRILLTHFHRDHAGLAGQIQAESGASVHIHRADAEMVTDTDATGAYQDLLERRFTTWRMPDAAREELLQAYHGTAPGERNLDLSVVPFENGETLAVGDRRLEAIHLPGHTAGQTGFLDRATGDLFAGDAVLPVYTPNVGGADVRVDAALARYAESLRRVVDIDPDRILPGHRDPIDRPVDRAREILGHHRDRTERVFEVLRRHGPADAWTVSAHLFGDLENIHILHGPGEASAHLEHLVDAGVVQVADGEYALEEGASLDIDAVLPEAG